MEGKHTATVIVFTCIIAYVLVLFYNMANVKAYNPVIVYPMLMLIFGLTVANNWGDLFDSLAFLRAPPLFMTESGVAGRLVRSPEPLPAGRMKALVSFNRAMLPRHIVKRSRGNIMDLLGMYSTATVTIEVIGHHTQFKKVDDRDCESPNGAWRFIGRLDGAELHDPEVSGMQAELIRISDKLGAVITSMKVYGQELTSLVNQRHLDDDYTYNRAKNIADNMKNVKIMPKGGASGSVEAIADEM